MLSVPATFRHFPVTSNLFHNPDNVCIMTQNNHECFTTVKFCLHIMNGVRY